MNKKLCALLIIVLIIFLSFSIFLAFASEIDDVKIRELFNSGSFCEILNGLRDYFGTKITDRFAQTQSEAQQATTEHQTHTDIKETQVSDETIATQETPSAPETEFPTEIQETLAPQETVAVPESLNWHYAINKNELNMRDENNEIIQTIPSYSLLKVFGVNENDKSRSWVEWNGYTGHVLNSGLFKSFYAKTIRDVDLYTPDGEFSEVIPENSLVYVRTASSTNYNAISIIDMRNGKTGTIADGNIEVVDDGIFTSIAYQNVTIIFNGNYVLKADVITGMHGIMDTPKGAFSVIEKAENTNLTDYKTYSVDVKYWVEFFDGCGFHDSTKPVFGGIVYYYDGSHGCVNCPEFLAQIIYKYSYIGMPVYVA